MKPTDPTIGKQTARGTIQDNRFVTLHAWIVTRLGLTANEAIVYALIYGYKDGFDQPISYIAQWLNASDMTARRTLQHLVEVGYIVETKQSGKPTSYRAVPLTNCNPSQIVTPNKLLPLPLTNCKGSYNNYDSNSSSSAHAPARERLTKWVAESGLQDWIARTLHRYQPATTDTEQATAALLDEFYDNDFTVREECERSERTAVLKHFQNWLPKYLRKLKTENDNANHHPTASPRHGTGASTTASGNARLTDLNDIARSIELGLATGTARREQ